MANSAVLSSRCASCADETVSAELRVMLRVQLSQTLQNMGLRLPRFPIFHPGAPWWQKAPIDCDPGLSRLLCGQRARVYAELSSSAHDLNGLEVIHGAICG
jgi:hypothetical protein